jgi:hypothetical protein
MKPLASVIAALATAASPAALAQFSINFTFSDPLTSSQQAAFDAAAATWEGVITGYQENISLTGVDIVVDSNGAIPTSGPTKALLQGGYVVSDEGRIYFDPLAPPSSDPTVLEIYAMQGIAAAIGFGTLWEANALYAKDSGQYLGEQGLSAYQSEFNPSATFIPVELYAGENNLHWDEIDLGAGLTGITDSLGRDFGNEVMTAWAGPDSNSAFLSNTTVRSLEDLGFSVALAPAPEPSACSLLALAFAALLLRRRRS